MSIGISAIAASLPEQVVTNNVFIERHGFDPTFLTEKIGIESRRWVSGSQATSDLATAAADAVLTHAGVAPEAVELLLVVTQTPDRLIPHVSGQVHGNLGLPKTTAAFDVSLGCSGFVYGLSLATAFMTAHGMDTGILVTAETYSRFLDPSDRQTAPLFGDGACACLLTRAPVYRPGAFTFGSDGGRHEALILRGSGSRDEARAPLYMDGRGIFNFVLREIPGDIDRCLDKNGLLKEDIDLWVFHQASRFLLESLTARCGLAPEKVVIDLLDCGNTVSSSIPLALSRRVFGPRDYPRRIFLSGFGVGLSFASTVLTLE